MQDSGGNVMLAFVYVTPLAAQDVLFEYLLNRIVVGCLCKF
jgi:hypothetical protein